MTKSIVLTHSGELPLTGLEVAEFEEGSPFSFAGGAYPGEGGTCGNSLVDGESCTITLAFIPNSVDSWRGNLTISYFDGVRKKSLTIAYLGRSGDLADISADSTSLDFGINEILSTVKKTIIISNNGALSAEDFVIDFQNQSAHYRFAGGSYPGIGGNCGNKLLGNTSCKLVIEFNPQSVGTHNEILKIRFKNPYIDKSLSLNLSGKGANFEALLSFKPVKDYSFVSTTIGTTKTKIFTIENNGLLPAENINFDIDAPFFIGGHTCTDNKLAIGETCTVTVNFSPTVSGSSSDSLNANYNNGKVLTSVAQNISGTAVETAVLDFSVSNYDFGSLGIGKTLSYKVKVTNNGGTEASGITFSNLSVPFVRESTTCKTTLAPLGSCSYTVSVTVTSPGPSTQDLILTYNNGSVSTTSTLSLSVTGKDLAYLVYENFSLSIPHMMVNDSNVSMVTMSNLGTRDATSVTPGFLSGAFSFLGGSYPGTGGTCGATLAAGANCSIFIQTTSPTGNYFTELFSTTYWNNEEVDTVDLNVSAMISNFGSIQVTFGNPDELAVGIYQFAKTGIDVPYYNNIRINQTADYAGSNVKITEISIDNPAFNIIANNLVPNNVYNLDECLNNILSSSSSSSNGCWSSFSFVADNIALYPAIITIKYLNDLNLTNEVTETFPVIGEVADMGAIIMDQLYDFGNVAKDGSVLKTITLTNVGTASVSSMTLKPLPATSKFTLNSNLCTGTLLPGDSCDLVIKFSPTVVRTYDTDVEFTYNNSVFNKKIKSKFVGNGKTSANLKFSVTNKDFGPSLINVTKSFTVTVSNSGGTAATNMSFNAVSSPFQIIDSNCGTKLEGISTCQFYIDYTPFEPGHLDQANIVLNYKNGVDVGGDKTITLSVSGLAEVPPASHKGWTEIYAVGGKKTVLNVETGSPLVRLRWKAMQAASAAYPIASYRIFKSTTSGVYDLSSPVGNTTDLVLEDTNVASGTTYYYMVRPIVAGTISRTTENFSEVKVIVPPYNMVLIHQWMANLTTCEMLGAAVEMGNNFRCSYSGPGTTNGKFDLGYHLLVDRYELGADGTPRPGQMVYINSQSSAWGQCQNTINDVYLDGSELPIKKRLLSRKEHLIASTWPSTLSHSDINDLEQGATGSGKCNGQGPATNAIGSNIDCVSKFGAEDMAGNTWEWVSDRLINGIGVTADTYKLDITNADMDGINQTTELSSAFENKTCYNPIIGLPLAKVNEQCPTGSVEIATSSIFEPTVQDFFQNDYFYRADVGVRMAAVGGNYSQFSGRFTLAWLGQVSTGARCAAKVP